MSEAATIGVRPGERVRVRKGAVVRTTGSRHEYTTGRATTVTVSRVDHDGTVHWAGSGGYWCWTSPDNVTRASAG